MPGLASGNPSDRPQREDLREASPVAQNEESQAVLASVKEGRREADLCPVRDRRRLRRQHLRQDGRRLSIHRQLAPAEVRRPRRLRQRLGDVASHPRSDHRDASRHQLGRQLLRVLGHQRDVPEEVRQPLHLPMQDQPTDGELVVVESETLTDPN